MNVEIESEEIKSENDAKQLRDENKTFREQKINALLIGDAIDDGIYLMNPDGIITDVNQKYCQITGLSKEFCIGKYARELKNEYFVTKEAAAVKALRKKEKVTIITQARETGKELLVTSCPIKSEDGKIIQIITVMRDITELKHLEEQLHKSRKISELYKEELNYLRNVNTEGSDIIGESTVLKNVINLVHIVSRSDATVLISGETGTGKELLASEIYKNSKRKDGPYIKINCAAFSESLLESELFGYEKGSFTGAINTGKVGLFEMADQGTLLLDEIGELPLSLQPKLLRVLQEKEVLRVGGVKPIKTNVRIIAATNRNLIEEVEKGRFRKDLYYRLQVIPIIVPPLRDRENDVSLLIKYFLEKFNSKYNQQKSFPDQAYEILRNYQWPGNIRELANVIERLVVINPGDIISIENVRAVLDIAVSPKNISLDTRTSLKELLNEYERDILTRILKETGSTYKAAKVLDISQPSIARKAKAYGITY